VNIVQYMLGFRNADGGVVRALIDLVNLLAAHGHQVTVLTVDAVDAPRDWDGRDGRPLLKTLKPRRLLGMLADQTSLGVVDRSLTTADVVHLHVPWDPICAQIAGRARKHRVPYVVTVHGMLDDWTMSHGSAKKKTYLAVIGRRMLEGAAFVHSAAKIEAEQSARWHPRGRSIVVPLPFDAAPFASMPGPDLARSRWPALAGDRPVLLTLGRLHPIKRLNWLLEVAAELGRQGQACIVALAGSGESSHEQQLRDLAGKMGLRENVIFTGLVGGEEKRSLFQASTLMVHPSAHESFGYSMIEALATGLPLVTTKAVNLWPELHESGGAIIAEPSPAGLAASVKATLGDPERLKNMSQQGRQWVRQEFEPSRLARSYQMMYESCRSKAIS